MPKATVPAGVENDCLGVCCAAFRVAESPDELRARARKHRERDIEFMVDMLIPLTPEEAEERSARFGGTLRADPQESRHYYACRHWDEETRLCTVWPQRPRMCASFPYGEPCTLGDGCLCRSDYPALKAAEKQDATERVRRLCLGLPETSERLSHGAPSFFVRDKRCFVMVLDNHHGDGIFGLWVAAPAGGQELRVGADPESFFRPPYVGHRGWLGVRLDRDLDWDQVGEIVEDAWATVAPKRTLEALRPPE